MGVFGVISLFVFLIIISLSLISSTQAARWHHHHHHHHNSKHNKHLHESHNESTISQPPHESPAYPPDEPPENDDPDVDPPFYSPQVPPVFAPPESSIAPSIPPVIVPPSPPPAEPPVKLPPTPPAEPPVIVPPPPVEPPVKLPPTPPPPAAEAPVIVPPTPPPAAEAPVIVAPPPTAEPPVIVLPTPTPPPPRPAEPPAKSYIVPPPAPAPAPEPSTGDDESGNVVIDVRKFGGVGDGKTDDTDAFKLAWETACQQNDSAVAVILVPYGFKFMIQSTIFTGPCLGGLVLQLDGTIMPPDGPEAWPQKNSKRQWLVFYRVNQMSLIGGGAIDGRGQKWWDLPCKPHKGINGTTMPGPCDSPIAIRFFMSTNLTVEGIRIKDSPQFNFRFDNCKNVHIQSIHITAPALSPNTDGIHIENTNNVEIYDSVISNGDDCVSIGSGCYDVDIRNITCGPSHGISIGSLGNHNSKACVSNITVRDSVIKSSDNGVRIKTWQGGSGAVTGITFSNIHMDNVKNPIIIDQFYCLTKECTNQTSAVLVSDILYQNIKGTYNIRTPPMRLACSDSVPCTNLTLSDVELLPAQGDLVLDPYCWNAYGDLQTLTIPPVFCLMDGSDRSLLNNQLDFCF